MASHEGKRLATVHDVNELRNALPTYTERESNEGKELKFVSEVCGSCDSGDPPQMFCEECREYLCGECTKHHRRIKKTKDHNLREVVTSEVVCSACDSNDTAHTYCRECDEYMCTECTKHHKRIRKTKQHNLENLDTQISGSGKLPTKVELVNMTSTDGRFVHKPTTDGAPHYVSKHVEPESFLMRQWYNGAVKLMSYTGETAVMTDPPCDLEPLNNCNKSILTIASTRHVIVSKKAMHFCDNSQDVYFRLHTQDGYIPDLLGYINKRKFFTVCVKQKKIRYHDVNTSEVIETYNSSSADSKDIEIKNTLAFTTRAGDILLHTHQGVSQFSVEGVLKRVLSIHKDFFECESNTLCMDPHNNIFGVQQIGQSGTTNALGIIHVFGLSGGHDVLGQIEISYVYSAGVDDKRNLYISYRSNLDVYAIRKYKY